MSRPSRRTYRELQRFLSDVASVWALPLRWLRAFAAVARRLLALLGVQRLGGRFSDDPLHRHSLPRTRPTRVRGCTYPRASGRILELRDPSHGNMEAWR